MHANVPGHIYFSDFRSALGCDDDIVAKIFINESEGSYGFTYEECNIEL